MGSIKRGLAAGLFLLLLLCVPVRAQGYKAGNAGKLKLYFYDENGNEYTDMRKTVKRLDYVYLPRIPAEAGYRSLGWSQKAGGPARYKEGAGIRVTRSMRFYAVRREIRYPCTVTFCDETGAVSGEYGELQVTVEKNSQIELPSVANPAGKTFLGWSREPFANTSPDYREGDKLRVRENTTLYAVMFDRSTERDIVSRNLARVNTKKLSKVIFVGDSRTNSMQKALKDEFSRKELRNLSFVAKNGKGLSWFKKTGVRLLMKEIASAGGKPTAVVINLGVNDLKHDGSDVNFSAEKVAGRYVAYMKQLAEKLRGKNCRLFYMSVNPVNGAMQSRKASRREGEIRTFNNALRKGLRGTFGFLDTNTWLHENGFSTGRLYEELDDGVHYEARTYKRIYNYCIKAVNAAV